MKKTIMAIGILLAAHTGTFAQTNQDSTKTHKMKTSKTVKYTCTNASGSSNE
jgi:hypothetical protein